MSNKTFNSYKAKVLNGHFVGSNQLLHDVRKNFREAYGSKNDKDIVDIGVSYDGSWLTKGHTSNIGLGCVIDLLTGFVIDYEVMSK
ncbi:uncharacterized protein TNCV_2245841 [Trichonephila clavipes]|uniref:Mutator-like transposase domain-containing protein n=1 Tax=Trichonephila clavipes TaxID=2585209 RepID=A0A8X6RCS4_TRICX|nr:uncharacterized protein TNCV_2245841 [Trichonephila clavipes]